MNKQATPVYGIVSDLKSLPIGTSMLQALPSCDDLQAALDDKHERLVAGYEVLLAHYLEAIADARRWRYVRDNHAWAHSPHMDGTFYWRFTPLYWVRATSVEEAVDKLMRKEYEP